MTAFANSVGEFERELMLLAVEDGKAVGVAEGFVKKAAGELQLVELEKPAKSEEEGVAWVSSWRQENLAASRKQVAPLLREAMKA